MCYNLILLHARLAVLFDLLAVQHAKPVGKAPQTYRYQIVAQAQLRCASVVEAILRDMGNPLVPYLPNAGSGQIHVPVVDCPAAGSQISGDNIHHLPVTFNPGHTEDLSAAQ